MEELHCYSMLIVSGPSGAGKSTLLKVLEQHIHNFYFSVSSTTRIPRDSEQHGRDYFFISRESFLDGISKNEFLEYEEVHGNLYGTSNIQIKEAIKQHKFIVFDIDVKGHGNIKAKYPKAKSIFITPKDLDTLEKRLHDRKTDSKEVIQRRLLNACEELKCANTFDYLLINDNISESEDAILSIARSMAFVNHKAKLDDLIKHYTF